MYIALILNFNFFLIIVIPLRYHFLLHFLKSQLCVGPFHLHFRGLFLLDDLRHLDQLLFLSMLLFFSAKTR